MTDEIQLHLMSPPLYELTLDCNTAMLIVGGAPWHVERFNPTVSRWLMGSIQEGQPLSDHLHCNELALKRRLSRGRVASFEAEVLGELKLPVLFTVTALEELSSEGVERYLLEGQDLSRAKSAEHMLTTYSSMIEEKTRELEVAISARDAFLSAMSHELRTPLNLMVGFSESLLDEVYGELAEEQRGIVEQIYTSGLSLSSLLTNLLSLSRIRSGKLDLRPQHVDLKSLCHRVIGQQEESITLKRLQLSVEEAPCCQPYVDEQWCEQMIGNLLSNAVKFTPEDLQIGVRFSSGDGFVRVTVWDQGIGIPANYHNKIFQPFFQVDSTLARSYEGSGLGLSLVAEVSRLHGGDIRVESAPQRGSQFHLELPCAPPSERSTDETSNT